MAKYPVSLAFLVIAVGMFGDASKISSSLQRSLRLNPKVNVFVGIQGGTAKALQQATASLVPSSTHAQRTSTVYNALVSHSQETQKDVLSFIQDAAPSLNVKSFWINNQIYIQDAPASLIVSLAEIEAVSEIQEDRTLHIKDHLFQRSESHEGRKPLRAADWGLERMRVPEVWNMTGGNTGAGLVVGNIDTGVRGSHELLYPKWVGLENYGWLDPEQFSSVPNDVYNHGKSCRN
jgi:hypothetical protein